MPDPVPVLPAPSLIDSAIGGKCPRCGAKTLFASLIGFAPECRVCGLDYAAFNVGDGPAAFLTLIVGAIVVLGAVTLELAAHPPFWVHILIWPLVTLGLVLGGLRVAKGALLASEYRNAAREGKLKE